MALLSKKEVAKKCGWQTNKLSTYISRGKVVVKNDRIDTEDDVNRAFLEKYSIHDLDALPQLESYTKQKTNSRSNNTQEEDPGSIEEDDLPPLSISNRRYMHLKAVKTERENALLKLKEEKIRGEVIPSDLVKPLFLMHNNSMVHAFKNLIDEEQRRLVKRYGINVNEAADMRSRIIEGINEAMKKATKSTTSNISNIIKEYAVKKGVGERE